MNAATKTILDIEREHCFGFFRNEPACETCPARTRCRAALVTTGFDLLGGLIEQLLDTLPEGDYSDSDRQEDILRQVLFGPDNPLDADWDNPHVVRSGGKVT